MSEDRSKHEDLGVEEQGATEDQMQKIDAIVGDEVMGYQGSAHAEHSGPKSENETEANDGLEDRLADNRPEQVE